MQGETGKSMKEGLKEGWNGMEWALKEKGRNEGKKKWMGRDMLSAYRGDTGQKLAQG